MTDNTIYWLWLQGAASPGRARKLLKTYGSIENIYNRTDYSEAPYIKDKALEKLCNKNITSAKNIYDRCSQLQIEILTPDSHRYPASLLKIPDYPIVLYAKGVIPAWEKLFTVAIVGTRHLSSGGLHTTAKICDGLVSSGATIVSGFAEGADTVAAEAAIRNNSFTVAVLGCGVDVVYPKSNAALYNKLLKNGVFLSEYPPGTKPIYYNFPARNRIIAGLCRGVIVTEAPEKSGSVITGKYAIKYGINLFAVPEKNTGTDLLIRSGAVAVTDASDVTREFPELPEPVLEEASAVADPILELLAKSDMTIDDLCAKLGITMTECNSRCFMLELEGKIIKMPGGFYRKN